jgi:hypothetical protein
MPKKKRSKSVGDSSRPSPSGKTGETAPATRLRTKSIPDRPTTNPIPPMRDRSKSQGDVVQGRNVVRDVTAGGRSDRRASGGSELKGSRDASAIQGQGDRPAGVLVGRSRSHSITEGITPPDSASRNITFGRKISDADVLTDVRTIQDQIGINFTTKDVLEQLAKDFEVDLDPQDTEAQIREKLKQDRVINQDDFDAIDATVTRLKTERKIPDQLLQESITQAKLQSISEQFSAKAVLAILAKDFDVTLTRDDTEPQILEKLKRDRVLNQSDYDFIVANIDPSIQTLRVEARQRADAIANDVITRQVQKIEADAETQKATLLAKKTVEATSQLSTKHTRNLGQPKTSDKYIAAKVALDAKIAEISASDLAQINRLRDEKITNLTTEGLATETQQQYKNFNDFLTSTDYHPFSFSALDVSGQFSDAASLVALVQRKPNMQALVTAKYYTLLNDCLRILGEDMTSAILSRINEATLAQFQAIGDDGLMLLRELHAQGGIVDNKLTAVGNRLQNIQPLTGTIANKQMLATLLTNHTVNAILNLTNNLTKFAAAQRLNTLQLLRSHTISADALLTGLELANRLNWSEASIQTEITALPLNSTAQTVTDAIYARALRMFNKEEAFAHWIHSLNLLMTEADYTLRISDARLLPGGTTYERRCRIYDDDGNYQDDFVIHYHPGATGAAVGSAYASKRHIKPISGDTTTPRMYWESIPDTLKAELPSKH